MSFTIIIHSCFFFEGLYTVTITDPSIQNSHLLEKHNSVDGNLV